MVENSKKKIGRKKRDYPKRKGSGFVRERRGCKNKSERLGLQAKDPL